MDNMIKETEQIKYVIKVNGQVVSIQFASAFVAEQAVGQLAPEQQAIAEVVPVTASGKEVLLG